MARKRYTPEEIIQHLRTVELEQGKGATLEQAAKKIGVVPQTIVRWRNEYGGMKVKLFLPTNSSTVSNLADFRAFKIK